MKIAVKDASSFYALQQIVLHFFLSLYLSGCKMEEGVIFVAFIFPHTQALLMAEKKEEEEMRTVGHAFHTRGRFGERLPYMSCMQGCK